MLKLGTMVTDTVTGMKGMLTMFDVDMGGNENYLMQPQALSKKTMRPLDTIWLNEKQIEGAEMVDITLPVEILGTEVEDIATGYKGTAVALNYHMNGCIHFVVKASGVNPEDGEPIKSINLDIRRCKGVAIKEMNEEELAVSRKTKPSPEFGSALRTR